VRKSRFGKMAIVLSFWCVQAWQVRGQGVIKLNFENVPDGTTFSYIHPSFPWPPSPQVVSGSGFGAPAFEGQKSFHSSYSFGLSSPDEQLIIGFSLAFYAPTGAEMFGVTGIGADLSKRGQWQTITGSFTSPVERLGFFSYYTAGIETFDTGVAVDDITLYTVPEPGMRVLFTVGGLVIAVWSRRREAVKG
jgi:hypothetical protein